MILTNKAVTCPNTESPEFKKLRDEVGLVRAYELFIQNGYTTPDLGRFNSFSSWLVKNTSNINFSVVDGLIDSHLINDGAYGYYSRQAIKLSKWATPGVEYHEALHAIVHSFLTDEEIDNLYELGYEELRSNANAKELIREYAKAADASGIQFTSAAHRSDYIIEEYIADRFRDYKLADKKEPQGMLEKLLAYIASIVDWFRGNRRTLNKFFASIDKGAYKGAGIASNRFARGDIEDMAFSVILHKRPRRAADGRAVIKKFSAEETSELIRDVAGYVFRLQRDTEEFNPSIKSDEAAIEEAISRLAEYYGTGPKPNADIHFALTDRTGPNSSGEIVTGQRDILRAAVYSYLQKMAPYNAIANDELEDGEEVGVSENKEATNPAFDKDPSELGAWDKQSVFLRRYIATASYVKDDTVIAEYTAKGTAKNEQPSKIQFTVKSVVEPNRVYNGLLRAAGNTKDTVERFTRMYQFSKDNEESMHFMRTFLADTGLDAETTVQTGRPHFFTTPDVKKLHTFQAVMKGFDKYAVDPMGLNFKMEKDSISAVAFIENVNKADRILLDSWANTFQQVFFKDFNTKTSRDSLVNDFVSLMNRDLKNSVKLNPELIDEYTNNIISTFNRIGMKLNRGFVRYGVVKSRYQYYKNKGKKDQNMIDEGLLSREDINFIKYLKIKPEWELNTNFVGDLVKSFKNDSFTNPFEIDEAFDDNKKSNMVNTMMLSKIRAIAKGAVVFDETAFESSYKAKDGTTRYVYQNSTFHVTEMLKLQDKDMLRRIRDTGIKDLNRVALGTDGKPLLRDSQNDTEITAAQYKTFKELGYPIAKVGDKYFLKEKSPVYVEEIDADIRKNSILFTDASEFGRIIEEADEYDFNLQVIGGFGYQKLTKSLETGQSFMADKNGLMFGDMGTKEFSTFLFNLYVTNYEKIQLRDGTEIYTIPHSLGIMESSKSNNLVYLPMINNLWNEGKPTDKAIGLLVHEITNELQRINKVYNEIFVDGVQLTKEQLDERLPLVAKDYHYGATRGLKLTENFKFMLGNDTDEKVAMSEDGQVTEKVSGLVTRLQDLMKRGPMTREEISVEIAPLMSEIKERIEEQLASRVESGIKILEDNKVLVKKEGKYSKADSLLSAIYFTDNRKSLASNFVRVEGNVSTVVYDGLGLNKGVENNIGQMYMQQLINVHAFTRLLTGDSALMHKSISAVFKRDKTKNASGETGQHNLGGLLKGQMEKDLGLDEDFDYFRGVVLQEQKLASITNPGHIMDIADAQAWGTPKGIAKLMMGLGRMTPSLMRILWEIQQGIPVENKFLFERESEVLIEQDRVQNSYKLVFRDPMTTFKMSYVILSPELVQTNVNGKLVPALDRKPLADMYEMMKRLDVELVAMETASKTATYNVVSKEKDNSYDFSKTRPVMFNTDYLRLQLENPSNKLKITTPTQLRQAIDTEQDDDMEVMFAGKLTTIGEVKKIYQRASSNKTMSNFYQILGAFYTLEDFTKDIEQSLAENKLNFRLQSFHKKALESLEASGATNQEIDFFKLDAEEQPMFNLNNPLTVDKFTSLYFATMTKGTFGTKSPGSSAALLSSYGFNPIKKLTGIRNGVPTWEVIRKDSTIYKRLHTRTPEFAKLEWADELNYKLTDESIANLSEKLKGGDVYFQDRLRYNVPEFDKDGNVTGYFSEALMSHHKVKQPIGPDDRIPDHLAKMLGNRIPLQDKHSMIAIKLVDFLPNFYGSTIVAPPEIIEISGADFDIDKLYLTMYDTYYNHDKGRYEKYQEMENKEAEYNNFLGYLAANNKTYAKKVREYTGPLMKQAGDAYSSAIENLAGDDPEVPALQEAFKKARKEARKMGVQQALTYLQLPKSAVEYQRFVNSKGGIHTGISNNKILDSMFALLTNDKMRKIAIQPADQKIFEDLKDDERIKNSVLGLKESEEPHSPFQQIKAKEAITVGKSLIEVYVANQKIYTLLNKIGAKINDKEYHVTIGGVTYDGFDKDIISYNGKEVRTMYTQSGFISAATDEANDQNNAYFGLNNTSGTVAQVLNELGVPFPIAIALVSQPLIREYLRLLDTNNGEFTKADQIIPSKDSQFNEAAVNIGIQGKDDQLEVVKFEDRDFNPDKLFDYMQKSFDPKKLNATDKLEYQQIQKVVYTYFHNTLELQKKWMSPVGTVLNLSKGIRDQANTQRVEEAIGTLGLNNEDAEPVIDVRYAFTGDDKMPHGNGAYVHEITKQLLDNFKIFNELKGDAIITSNKDLSKVSEGVLENMKLSVRKEERDLVKRNLLSFLTIQIYKRQMDKEGIPHRLRYSLIYPKEGEKTIADIFDELREKIRTEERFAQYRNNAFIQAVIPVHTSTVIATGRGKKTKSEIAQLNVKFTGKTTEALLGNIDGAFLDLYLNKELNPYMEDIIAYVVTMDGLQFNMKTLSKIIPAEVYEDFFNRDNSPVEFVERVYKAKTEEDILWIAGLMKEAGFDPTVITDTTDIEESKEQILFELTGMDTKQLYHRFYQLYLTKPSSYGKITRLNQAKKADGSYGGNHKGLGYDPLNRTLRVKRNPFKKPEYTAEQYKQLKKDTMDGITKAGFRTKNVSFEGKDGKKKSTKHIIFPMYVNFRDRIMRLKEFTEVVDGTFTKVDVRTRMPYKQFVGIDAVYEIVHIRGHSKVSPMSNLDEEIQKRPIAAIYAKVFNSIAAEYAKAEAEQGAKKEGQVETVLEDEGKLVDEAVETRTQDPNDDLRTSPEDDETGGIDLSDEDDAGTESEDDDETGGIDLSDDDDDALNAPDEEWMTKENKTDCIF